MVSSTDCVYIENYWNEFKIWSYKAAIRKGFLVNK